MFSDKASNEVEAEKVPAQYIHINQNGISLRTQKHLGSKQLFQFLITDCALCCTRF